MATTKKQTKAAAPKPRKPKHIGLVKNDSWLEPFEDAIRGRHEHALWKISQLTADGKRTLSDFASGHEYFGLHKTARGWVFREWAPNATEIYLVGDFNDWKEDEAYKAKRIEGTGNWELKLPSKAMKQANTCLGAPRSTGRPDQDILCSGVEPHSLRVEEKDFPPQERPSAHL